jgi:RNA polymerase sigma-70 factor (ECF subfamily)
MIDRSVERLLPGRSDAALVRRVAIGDTEAFDLLVARYSAPLYSFAARLVRSAEDGEDLVQQAFLNAWQALRAGVRPLRLAPWLFRITRNLCFDHLEKRRPDRLEDDAAERLRAPERAEPEHAAERAQALADVTTALGAIPASQREVLLLRELHGFDYAAIASILGISEKAVKSLLHRARGSLAAAVVRQRSGAACAEVAPDFEALAGGRLSPARVVAVQRHLRQCPSCRSQATAIALSRRSLQHLGFLLPTAALRESITASITSDVSRTAAIGGGGGILGLLSTSGGGLVGATVAKTAAAVAIAGAGAGAMSSVPAIRAHVAHADSAVSATAGSTAASPAATTAPPTPGAARAALPALPKAPPIAGMGSLQPPAGGGPVTGPEPEPAPPPTTAVAPPPPPPPTTTAAPPPVETTPPVTDPTATTPVDTTTTPTPADPAAAGGDPTTTTTPTTTDPGAVGAAAGGTATGGTAGAGASASGGTGEWGYGAGGPTTAPTPTTTDPNSREVAGAPPPTTTCATPPAATSTTDTTATTTAAPAPQDTGTATTAADPAAVNGQTSVPVPADPCAAGDATAAT